MLGVGDHKRKVLFFFAYLGLLWQLRHFFHEFFSN